MKVAILWVDVLLLSSLNGNAAEAPFDMEAVPYEGLMSLRLENEGIRLCVLPDLGAKIISLVNKRTGREWLWRTPDVELRPAEYAASFADYDLSGFDECFPTIGPVPYPEAPFQGVEMPDHGEVWALPWPAESLDGAVRLSVEGVRFPYRFTKTIRLPALDTVALDYEVEIYDGVALQAIWAAHPLFNVQPGMKIVLPEGTSVRRSDGEVQAWPLVRDREGQEVDLSVVPPPTAKRADKLFTAKLPERWAALYDPATGEFLALTFPDSPALGLWLNEGGWPPGEKAHYNVALEPTNAGAEEINMAKRWKLPCTWEGTVKWSLRLIFGQAETEGEIRGKVAEGKGGAGKG